MSAYEFIIHQKSVICTNCEKYFATPVNQVVSDMNLISPVETDLHRFLPYGVLRAAMVAICPFCQYAWWASTFSPHFAIPVGIDEAPAVSPTRKFAHAVLTGRQNNYHILDRALIALNGYWCAAECNEQIDKWLTMAIQELTAALAEQNWTGNRVRYHYILAELLRRQGDFSLACEQYDLVDKSANLPADLVKKQKQLASEGKNCPVLLTSKEIEEIFFPRFLGEVPPEIYAPRTVVETEAADSESALPLTTAHPVFNLAGFSSVPARKTKGATSSSSVWQDIKVTK